MIPLRKNWVGHIGPDVANLCFNPNHWESNINVHTCSNPNCAAWVDADHVPAMCPVCKEREIAIYGQTCGSPKCEKFMGEYELDLL